MYAFQSESTLYSCLNIKEILEASLVKWLSFCLQTKWVWVQISLLSGKCMYAKSFLSKNIGHYLLNRRDGRLPNTLNKIQ